MMSNILLLCMVVLNVVVAWMVWEILKCLRSTDGMEKMQRRKPARKTRKPTDISKQWLDSVQG